MPSHRTFILGFIGICAVGLSVPNGWSTLNAQVIPVFNGSRVVLSSGTVSQSLPFAVSDSAGETISGPDRDDVASQIDESEIALNSMKRPLDTEEQQTAAEVRTFISRAREALKYDDLDGAGTLSTKACFLLLEICKECRGHSRQKAKLRPISGWVDVSKITDWLRP